MRDIEPLKNSYCIGGELLREFSKAESNLPDARFLSNHSKRKLSPWALLPGQQASPTWGLI